MKKTKMLSFFLAALMIVGSVVVLPVTSAAATSYDVAADDAAALAAALGSATAGDAITLRGDVDLSSWTTVDLPADVIFDGNGYTITGLTKSLFGNLYGEVRNLTVENATVTSGTNRGVIAQKMYDGAVISHVDVVNCTITTGATAAGGIVAEIIPTKDRVGSYLIEYCTVSGTITNANPLGGIFGRFYSGDSKNTYKGEIVVRHCTNYATLVCNANASNGCGGIFGFLSMLNGSVTYRFIDDHNYGSITAADGMGTGFCVGGIGGRVVKCGGYIYFTDCSNRVDITFTNAGAVGGIVGYTQSSSSSALARPVFEGCVNTGDISGGSTVGGIAGDANYAGGVYVIKFTDCSNSGDITGTGEKVGGIAGTVVYAGMENCSNTGDVAGTDKVGGLVGYLESGKTTTNTITKISNAGSVTASSGTAGGFLGYQKYTGATVSLVLNRFDGAGAVSGDIAGGVIGEINYNSQTGSSTSLTRAMIVGDLTGATQAALLIGKISEASIAPTLSEIYVDAGCVVSEGGSPVAEPFDYYNGSDVGCELTYTSAAALYTVRFLDEDDTVLTTQRVPEGCAADAAKAPVRDGRVFSGWSAAYNDVRSDLNVKAAFRDAYLFEVGDKSDLSAKLALCTDVQDVVRLTSDIDVSGWATVATFHGTLDGAGHTLTGLSGTKVSLFGTVYGTVKDLTVDGGDGAGTSIDAKGNNNYGVIAALLDGGTVSGCAVKNYHISCSGWYTLRTSDCSGCGGIVGKTTGSVTIKNCTFDETNSITQNAKYGSKDGAGPVGGIVGLLMSGTMDISGCYNGANIQTNQTSWLGGIIGAIRGDGGAVLTMTDCVNRGALTGTANTVNVGGMIGFVGARAAITIKNCKNTGDLTANGATSYAGGAVGTSYSNGSGYEKYELTIKNYITDCTISGTTVSGLLGHWLADRSPSSVQPKVYITDCEVRGALIGANINAIGYFARANNGRYYNPMQIRHTVVSATVDDGDENNETAPTLAIVDRKSGMTATDVITIEESVFGAFGDADWVTVAGYQTLTVTKCIKGSNYYATAGDDPVDLGATCMTDGAAVSALNTAGGANRWIQASSYPVYLPAEFSFSAASLSLSDSFAINMMIRLPEAGEARTAIDAALEAGTLSVTASVGGGAPVTLPSSAVSSGGKSYLRYTWADLDATQMREKVTFTIVNGGDDLQTYAYSVADYAARMYAKDTSSAALKDLAVAMMFYGDAAQQKAGVAPALTALDTFKKALDIDSVATSKNYAGLSLSDGSSGTGVAVGLNLGTRIEVRFAELLAKPSVKVDEQNIRVTDNGDGTYSVFVTAKSLHLDLTVNDAVTFSVGDYIAKGIAGGLFSDAEEAVAQALAVYMDAALTYALSLD